MIVLAEPAPDAMVSAIKKAIDMLPDIDPHVMHERVSLVFIMRAVLVWLVHLVI